MSYSASNPAPMASHTGKNWAKGTNAPGTVSYDSHFFSGQDCFVFLYPYYHNKLIPLPVTQFQYGISQQKSPIFGAWSYHWDAVAKGQIIVQGEFSIVYTMPNLLGTLLGKDTEPDFVKKNPQGGVLPLLDNSKSMEVARRKDLRNDIWGNGKNEEDPTIYGIGTKKGRNVREAFPFGRKEDPNYCGHQPFDIVIAYGDNPSMHFTDSSEFEYGTWIDLSRDYQKMMSMSINEEGWTSSRRVRIESVELMSAGTLLDVSGQPLQETYSFIARDVNTPNVLK